MSTFGTAERQKVSVFVAFLWGLAAISLVASPGWLGFLAYLCASYLGSRHADVWAKVAGWAVLLLLPTVIMGRALRDSYIEPAETTPTGSPGSPEESAPADTLEKEARPISWEEVEREKPSPEVMEAWKMAVQVQQHFNQLELQIRNFAITLVAAVIGAAAFAIKESYVLLIGSTAVSAAVPVFLAGVVGLLAFYFMDRFWYHNLLIGSVKHALKIEKRYSTNTPELGLSTVIGKSSPQTFWRFEIHSSQKIDLFYAAGLTLLIVLTGGILLAKHVVSETGNATAGNGRSVEALGSKTQNVSICSPPPHIVGKKKAPEKDTACPTTP